MGKREKRNGWMGQWVRRKRRMDREWEARSLVPRPLRRALYPLFAHAQAPHVLCGIENFYKIDSVTLAPVSLLISPV